MNNGQYPNQQPASMNLRFMSRRRQPVVWLILLVLFLLSFGASMTAAAPLHPRNTSVACALTPNTLGGQGFNVAGLGFNVAGLGFNVAGLGFNVAGLGFNVAGLGFNVAGLGIDPLAVAQEIRDNAITNQWLQDLLPGITGGYEYNTVKTAVIIIDDVEHGNSVEAVYNHLFSIGTADKIQVFRINVGDAATGYDTAIIKALLEQKIAELELQGFKHFVINMSFGLIPCDDAGPVIDNMQYPSFDFDAAIQWIETTNANFGLPKPVRPVLECVTHDGEDLYTAYFGYKNENDRPVVIPLADNRFTPAPAFKNQPTLFETGRQRFAFSFQFDIKKAANVVWTLKSPDGSTRTATASATSTQCETVPPYPADEILPIAHCVADNGNGTYTAKFGYNNLNPSTTVYVPVDAYGNNTFSPAPENRGQPTHFLPGFHPNIFSVVFDGNPITWSVVNPFGPDESESVAIRPRHSYASVTADLSLPACLEESTQVGMIEYVSQVLNVPADKVDDYFKALSDNVDDELNDLKALLHAYLDRSAASNGAFAVYPVASAGNFRPSCGGAPLAPARWIETIAVSASVGNNGPLWGFSHDGNVIAPGVAFRLPNNSAVAGTSFAAPFIGAYLAHWGTYPNACSFPMVDDHARPPLKNPNALFNAPTLPNQESPFTCVLPEAPKLVTCYATTVVSYVQGRKKDGSRIATHRSDPNKALGVPQNDDTWNFYSLGFDRLNTSAREGWLVLGFADKIQNIAGNDLRVWETSFNDKTRPWSRYPEVAEVYASQTGADGTWVYLGKTTDKDQAYDLGTLPWAQFVKLVDATDRGKFKAGDDGFDVDAVEGFGCLPSKPIGQIVSLPNIAPFANAGEDIVVEADAATGTAVVKLDGRFSNDPDGSVVSFAWSLDGYEIKAKFKTKITLPVGTYTVTLTVTDNAGAISTDTQVITVIAPAADTIILPTPISVMGGLGN